MNDLHFINRRKMLCWCRSCCKKGFTAVKGKKPILKTKKYIIPILAGLTILLSGTVHAKIIGLGQIDFTGNFTLNHLYNFNDPAASPFGTFGTQTVQDATGIFAPYVAAGDTLGMNTEFMFGVVTPSQPMTRSIGGFTLDTQLVLIMGADFVGRECDGGSTLSGNGFNPQAYQPYGAFSYWEFTAPPYDISNFPADITGPINLKIVVGYDNGHVPDSGVTFGLLTLSLAVLGAARKLLKPASNLR